MTKYLAFILISLFIYSTGLAQSKSTVHKQGSVKKVDTSLYNVISYKKFKDILIKLDVNHDSMITANELPITDGDYKSMKAKRNKDGNYSLPIDSLAKYFSNGRFSMTFEGEWDKSEEIAHAIDANHDGIIEKEEIDLSPQMVKYLADEGQTTVMASDLTYSFGWGVLILGHKLVYIPASDNDKNTKPKRSN